MSSKINISVLDLVVLMYNVYHSAFSQGYEDAEMSLDELSRKVNSMVSIDAALVEKMLYCANTLDEKGRFWHYRNKGFDELLAAHPTWPKFDKERNYFKGD